ncbi:hypothetical protein [Bdellovibrio sp. HCB274]|uniref:hypothetical protein n=1 Tax=Bdellovibrio sp. HCB274 TaxID=3394361 RepID=UPI0039B6C37A
MKLLSMLILSLTIFAASAQAYEGTMQYSADGSFLIKPLAAQCTPDIGDQVSPPSSCKPSGKACPEGYTRSRKYCWGGWKKGFYYCGVACNRLQNCKWGPHGDYKCGNPGSGHNHGSNPGHG